MWVLNGCPRQCLCLFFMTAFFLWVGTNSILTFQFCSFLWPCFLSRVLFSWYFFICFFLLLSDSSAWKYLTLLNLTYVRVCCPWWECTFNLHVYFQLWWLEIYKVQIWKVKNKCSGLYFYFCMHKAQPHPWTDVCTVRSVCMYAFNIQIHLSLLPLSTEWQFLAEEEPSWSQGTCPLLPPPVPALISNMSSHHHRWMQRKHFLGRQC